MLSNILRRPRGLRFPSSSTSRFTPDPQIKVTNHSKPRNPVHQTRAFVYMRNGVQQQQHKFATNTEHHDKLSTHAQEWDVPLQPGLTEKEYLHLAAAFEEEFGRALRKINVSLV